MADVFISYANEDRDVARALADWLHARGLDVWWDHKIRAGESFDRVIEREIENARRVIVLWSAQSTTSEWVRNEAALAAERGVLVPAFIEAVKPPLEFRRRQAIDLIGWRGDPAHPGLQRLADAISGAPPANVTSDHQHGSRGRWRRWAIAAAAGVAIALAAYGAYKGLSSAPVGESTTPPSGGESPNAVTTLPNGGSSSDGTAPAGNVTSGDVTKKPRDAAAPRTPDVTGFWDFQPNEKRLRKYLELKAIDGTLLGQEVIGYEMNALTIMSGLKKQAPIVDGKVEGNRISFSTRRIYTRIPSDPSTRTESVSRYTGVIAGDKIHFTYSNESAGEYWEETAERRPAFKGAERLTRAKEHSGSIEDMALLPGGRFASASRDGNVIVWDIETMKVEATLDLEGWAMSAIPLPNARIATADNNGKVQIWDLQTLRVAINFAPQANRLERIVPLQDGRIAGAHADGSIAIWNPTTGAIDIVLKADNQAVLRLAALDDGRLAAGGEDGAIRVWNVRTGQAEATLRQGRSGSNQDVTALIELGDGRLAFSTLQTKRVEVTTIASKDGGFTLPSRVGQGVEWISRGTGGRIHVLENGNVLTTWNLATRKEENAFEVGADPYGASVVLELPDGRLLVGLGDGAIEVWKPR